MFSGIQVSVHECLAIEKAGLIVLGGGIKWTSAQALEVAPGEMPLYIRRKLRTLK